MMEQSHLSMLNLETLNLRSGNHTFEYLGFGPGNYPTAFPQTRVETLSADQVKFSQSIKEEAGVAASGLNSNGDLFIGNQSLTCTGQLLTKILHS